MRTFSSIKEGARRIVTAVAAACLLAAPVNAIAEEVPSADVALKAQSTDIARNVHVLLDSDYTYSGRAVEPKPTVYISVEDAYDYGIIGSDVYYETYFETYNDRYYSDVKYLWNDSWDDDGVDYVDIDDVLELVDDIDNLDALWSSYSLDRSYFNWLYDSSIVIDPDDQLGYVYVLDENVDYTLGYRNNAGPGTGYVVISGRGNFYGSVERSFTIIGSSSSTTPSSQNFERIWGNTRYDTMGRIANVGFSRPCNYAVVATGANFPDALAASSLAGAYNAPVLLTESNALSAQTSQTLSDLGVTYVFLMGGTSAISPAVESAIQAKGITVNRISGATRTATSVKVMDATNAAGTASNSVIIATGYNFADSLSIGPWAYSSKTPIILTEPDGTLSAEAVSAIKGNPRISNVIIVGGNAAVSDVVKTQLGGAYTINRLAGATRYETSEKIAQWMISDQGYNWSIPLVATGTNFPDALAGAALGGKIHSVMLLASNANDATVTAMRNNKSSVKSFYVLGGEAAVSNALATGISNAIK